MKIWIVDDDVAFVYSLKQKIKASRNFDSSQKENQIEVFQTLPLFLEALDEQKKSPSLILLNSKIGDQNTLDIFVKLTKNNHRLIKAICFCSSMSFGRFENFFNHQGLPTPSFIQKSQIEKELEKLLDIYASIQKGDQKKNDHKVKRFFTPLEKRVILEFCQIIKKMQNRYYETGAHMESRPFFLQATQYIAEQAQQLGLQDLQNIAGRLYKYLEPSKKTGMMRMKREMKDFFDLTEKILEEIRGAQN